MSSEWSAQLPSGDWIRYRAGVLESADNVSAAIVLDVMRADGFVLLGHTGPTIPADTGDALTVAAAVLSVFPETVGLPDLSSLVPAPVDGEVY